MTPEQQKIAIWKLWDLLQEAESLLWRCFEYQLTQIAIDELSCDEYLTHTSLNDEGEPSCDELPF